MTAPSARKNKRRGAKSGAAGAASDTQTGLARAAELAQDPVARSMLAAGLVAAAATLSTNAKVRSTIRDAGRNALDTAEAAADGTARIGAAIVAAATSAVRQLLAERESDAVLDLDPAPTRPLEREPELGRESRRGSFDSLVQELERDQLERGEQPTVSSAAFRAGAVIRMMRKSRGLTQAELAESLGVSQARVSEMEAGLGPRGPSWDLMERVANACSAIILVSPLESDRAIDASSPGGGRQWTVTAAGG